MNKQKRKGFTIVELVIVIAVIAILSAVLIPTFGTVVDNAEKSAATQEARNAYVTYVSEVDASEDDIESDVYVLVEGKYYHVVSGKVEGEGVASLPEAATGKCYGTVDKANKVYAVGTHVDAKPDNDDNKCAHCGQDATAIVTPNP